VFEQGGAAGALTPARFHWEIGSWVGAEAKAAVLDPAVHAAAGEDAQVLHDLEASFARCREEAGPDADPLDAHLRFQRIHNLACLLERLDRSSMLASVEGRVPFADQELLALCESFPADLRYPPEAPAERTAGAATGSAAVATLPRSKRVLRRAVADLVSPDVLARPKASFPLPFQDWIEPVAAGLLTSPFAAAVFQPEALHLVAQDPGARWSFAWPMVNIALWGDRWFS
jgi:asparagine synthase (glutamine-hydrolysing)